MLAEGIDDLHNGIGWDEADAALQAEIMTAAELCGNNQGPPTPYLQRASPPPGPPRGACLHACLLCKTPPAGLVKMYQPELMAPAPGAAKPTIERETATSAVVNANQSPGMLAATMAADLAAAKAQATGRGPIAVVSSHNTSTSSGQLAFYAERIARKGLVAVCMANSPEFAAAPRLNSRRRAGLWRPPNAEESAARCRVCRVRVAWCGVYTAPSVGRRG